MLNAEVNAEVVKSRVRPLRSNIRQKGPAEASGGMGVASAARSDWAGRARAVCRHQPRRALGDDRASLRRAIEPLLEAVVEARLVAERIAYLDDDRLAEWGYGITNLVPRATPGNRRPSSGGIRGRMDGARAEDPSIQARSRGARRGHALPGDPAAARGEWRRPRAGSGAGRRASAETIHGARVFVLPNPSGRNANFSYAEMLAAFKGLRREVIRAEREGR